MTAEEIVIYHRAADVIGHEIVDRWLVRACPALDNRAPQDVLRDPGGVFIVARCLDYIETAQEGIGF